MHFIVISTRTRCFIARVLILSLCLTLGFERKNPKGLVRVQTQPCMYWNSEHYTPKNFQFHATPYMCVSVSLINVIIAWKWIWRSWITFNVKCTWPWLELRPVGSIRMHKLLISWRRRLCSVNIKRTQSLWRWGL